jgi:hypothetical protein
MNYIKIKLSKRDVESIEDNLQLCLKCHLDKGPSFRIANVTKTLNMFRKRVKNGIKEKKPYKRTETYKK